MWGTLLVLTIGSITLNTLAGCAAYTGKEFDTSYEDKIVRVETNKPEMGENSSEPEIMTIAKEGEIWTYSFLYEGTFIDGFKYILGGSSQDTVDELSSTY